MATFRYSAYRAGGGEATGTIDADTPRGAAEILKQRGLYPREVVPLEAGKRAFRGGVKAADLALLTRRLATLVASAVPIYEALTALYEQEPPGELKQVLGRVRTRVAEGGSLAAALAADGRVFSESYVSMVAAGEASGALERVLERLADFLETQDRIRTRVSAALAYPVLMVIVGSGVMLFLLAFVIPRIVTMFQQSKAALPFITVAVIRTSDFLRGWWWLLGLLGAGLFFLYRRMLPDEAFRLKRDRLLLRLPLAGAVWRQL
ncbi:MAG TPA: type II secretion system F family protein, partial [Verrucomicrobiae bacterium]|nr:type II secretion system F family protein [Verrucomicrobiae bacterium]